MQGNTSILYMSIYAGTFQIELPNTRYMHLKNDINLVFNSNRCKYPCNPLMLGLEPVEFVATLLPSVDEPKPAGTWLLELLMVPVLQAGVVDLLGKKYE